MFFDEISIYAHLRVRSAGKAFQEVCVGVFVEANICVHIISWHHTGEGTSFEQYITFP